jgi:hypothetical protein
MSRCKLVTTSGPLAPIVPSDSDFSTLGSPVPQLYNRLKKQQYLRS